MLEAYAEYGAIGVIVLLFVGQIMFLQRTLMSKLKETDDKVIGLINRWNRSDEVRDRFCYMVRNTANYNRRP